MIINKLPINLAKLLIDKYEEYDISLKFTNAYLNKKKELLEKRIIDYYEFAAMIDETKGLSILSLGIQHL